MPLGRIEAVDIRTVWRNEAGDFTPWLAQAENLAALGAALHLGELTLQSTETGVGVSRPTSWRPTKAVCRS